MESSLTNIEEYYQEVKDLYNIDFEHFSIICKSPFKFIRLSMSKGELKNIRLKYLGIFKVSERRVKYTKKFTQEKYDKGLLSTVKYEKNMSILNNYIDDKKD